MILCKEEHAKAIDKAVFPMMQGGPIENNIAGKAVALKEAMSPEFTDYAHRTVRDARALAAGLADEGMRVVSGGTDSHLALVDVRPLGVDGKTAEAVCDEVGISLNKNQIPYDPNPPSSPVGDPRRDARVLHAGHGRGRDARDRRASWAMCCASPTTPAPRTRHGDGCAT